METRRRTRFDARGLIVSSGLADSPGGIGERSLPFYSGAPTIDGAARSIPFYAGAMHYWRVDPSRWDACLRAIHALGLTIVETYVPWREHAPAPDAYDWKGPRDLRRFLERARAAGLAVVLRPGPHCNAELTSFGMPDWVLAEPECQARTARGTPAWLPQPPRAFPIPSYASAAFRARVRARYAAVAEIVAPLAGDPVVALGVDNEAQLFFRTGAFDLDYHADALAWWREYSSLDEPPRAWRADDTARCIEWVRFKDRYIARALGDFAAMLDDVGLGELARFHNLPPGHYQLYDLPAIERAIAGPVGVDAYTPRAQFPELRRRAIACVSNARPLPIAFEVGVGFFPWFPPLDPPAPPSGGAARQAQGPAREAADADPTRERDHLLTLLACGMRGFNVFMAVARDRYYGAAIDETGKREAHAAWIAPLVAALVEVEWPTLRRAAEIALVDTRADARFGVATNVVDPMTPVLADALGFGPGGSAELGSDAGAIAARRWQTAIARALELAQVPYAIVDEATSEDELARYRAVIAPTIDRIDRGLAHALRALVEHKRCLVVVGPGAPHHDELGQPLLDALPKRVGRLEVGSLDDLAGLADDLARLAGGDSDAWQVERPDDVRAHAFVDPRGHTRVVFVLSDAARATNAIVLAGDRAAALRDPFTRERVRVVAGRATIAMPARGVRMFVVDEAQA